MAQHDTTPIRLSRRDTLRAGAALGMAALASRFPEAAFAFPGQPGEEVLPWLDQPAPNAAPDVVGTQLVWEQLDSWITPNDQFFTVHHYPVPTIAADGWALKIDGLVNKPLSLCLADLRARPRQEVTFTLECSGNHGFPWLTGAVGNATWAGTPLAPILQEAGILDGASRSSSSAPTRGEETVRDAKVTEQFARSMSVADAMDPNLILCYEMNGAPLPVMHGAPVRLIAPGWYGVANVKWLERIQVLPTRYEGRFMGRDYVTMRTEQHGGDTRDALHAGGPRPAQVGAGEGGAQQRPVPDHRRGVGAAGGAGGGERGRRGVVRGDAGRGGGVAVRLDAVEPAVGAARAGGAHRHLAGDRHAGEHPAGDGRPDDREQADLLGEQRADHPPRAHRLAHRPAGCARGDECQSE